MLQNNRKQKTLLGCFIPLPKCLEIRSDNDRGTESGSNP